MKPLFIFCITILFASCGQFHDDDEQATLVAQQWAEAYFNCDYAEALTLSTPESSQWLQFAASNTTQAMLDLQNRQHAEVEATDFFPVANDTLRVVEVLVSNYLKSTAINGLPEQATHGRFRITVVKRGNDWQVRMADLPRSEKQSRD